MSHCASGPQARLRAFRALLLALLGTLLFATAPTTASAAVVTLSGTDPSEANNPPLDLTSAKVDIDTTAGTVKATIDTVASNEAVQPLGVYVLLGTAVGGVCIPVDNTAPVFIFAIAQEPTTGGFNKWFVVADGEFGTLEDAPFTRSGGTLNVSAGPSDALKNKNFDCGQVQTKTERTVGEDIELLDVDQLDLGVNGVITVTPGKILDGGSLLAGASTADKDKDGVPDAADACKDVPGAAKNGCPTLADRLAVRLGAKRVAIDKLVARTGAKCPVKAKGTVKAGKKTLGTATLSVTQHGSFCRVYGAIKLKKSAKSVKITVKATGMGSIAATRKR